MTRKPMSTDSDGWPPDDPKEFIQSNDFGEIVLRWCAELSSRYPTLDFSDAASQVFAWFDAKISKNRRFINSRRFPTRQAFIAYVRTCVWNAAQLAGRQRRQRQEGIVALPPDAPIVANRELSPEESSRLREIIEEKLPIPHRDILRMILFEELDIEDIASQLDRTVAEIEQLYEEAIDFLDEWL
jgi:RNA polymerase sigma factor (sigma-70 family)